MRMVTPVRCVMHDTMHVWGMCCVIAADLQWWGCVPHGGAGLQWWACVPHGTPSHHGIPASPVVQTFVWLVGASLEQVCVCHTMYVQVVCVVEPQGSSPTNTMAFTQRVLILCI